ncbi:MAG: 2Fe-2S iron-sulfur cluster-binding protein [Methyloligellaceae bacterium]
MHVCTLGIVLGATAFLEGNPNPTPEEVSVGMSGNICRCGVYPGLFGSHLTPDI